ncbi:MAG: Hsp70 family protein [bacterium]|nr:Hsp70 family protein [bacterium]
MERGVGVDFGTTNSALAIVEPEGNPELAEFARADGTVSPTFRSVLYFKRPDGGREIAEVAGQRAIDHYLSADEPGRLMQSLKSFLARRDFTETSVLGRTYRLEALIAVILRSVREESEAQFGPLEAPVVVGRPVRFVGANDLEAEEFALARLRASFHNAGFPEVIFEYEPVAAAYHYESSLDRDELILIGDFGGGTSDFSLLRVGPGRSRDARDSILGTEGVGLAGDAFDGRIVRSVVSPVLGMGGRYRSVFGKELPVPTWIYTHLQRWHHLSFLKSPRSLQLLYDMTREAFEPERFEALLHLVQNDLGFELHRAVETAKLDLSEEEEAAFRFLDGPVQIEERVSREGFEAWIAPEVEAIETCIDRLLEKTSTPADEVDRVFLTGGTSLVPLVRALFVHRFGVERIRSGAELTSVASGLALRSLELKRSG